MRILKNHNHINVDWERGKTSNRVNSHRPVIFPFFKRSIQIPKPTVAHWGFENPGLFQKSLVIKLLKHRNNTQQCALTVSYTHRQPSHILINMWSRTFLSPPPSHLQIVPTYRTKQLREGGQRAATLFSCGLGMAERAAGRMTDEEEYEAAVSVLPGFVIKRYATLHLKCVDFVSFLFFSPKRVCFSRPGSLFFGCVLGYWHALCTGWTPDWAEVLRTGAAHCEPPESAASPPHQCFLKAYSHMAPAPRSVLRSDRATSCSSADRHIIHLSRYTFCECLITST